MATQKKVFIVLGRDVFFLSHRLPLALRLQREGYNVTVIAYDSGRGEEIRRHGLRFIPLAIDRRSQNPFLELRTVLFLFSLYFREKPDLVHHVTPKPILYGSFASRLLRIPTINAVAGIGSSMKLEPKFWDIPQWIVRTLYRIALAHPNSRSVFMNPDHVDIFVKMKLCKRDEKIVIIRGSGLDTQVFLPPEKEPEKTTVLFASRFLIDKGLLDYIEAIREIKPKYRNVCFAVAGESDEGNPTAVPMETVHQWEKEGLIENWGYHRAVEKIYPKSSIVVLPSYGEGVPKALLEALSCERACVATDVPGCRECVLNEQTGYLVPLKNPHALGQAIAKLIDDEEKRTRFGKNGRKLVEDEFSLERVLNRTTALYSELLNT